MSTLTLITQLKNTDLHALSAFEALTHIMGKKNLIGLRRKVVYTFTSSSSEEDLKKEIQNVIASSYKLVNPNKEEAFTEKLARPTSPIRLVKVSNEGLEEDAAKLSSVLSKNTTCTEKALVWELILEDETPSNDELLRELIQSTSRNQGLLANPILDQAIIVDNGFIYAA